MVKYLVGIDDTDNHESRGTGYLVRTLGQRIMDEGLGITGGISRHQLLFDPRVPYTSHNSSACLEVETNQPEGLWSYMVDYLTLSCAPGSDCGLCMVDASMVPDSLISWGYRAKTDLVSQTMALELAKSEKIKLIGLTGTHDGIIGAMAAVGLRASGNDGRFVLLKGTEIRTISGIKTLSELQCLVHLDSAITAEGEILNQNTAINLDQGWLRPIHKDGKIMLIISKTNYDGQERFQLADKEYIKSISN